MCPKMEKNKKYIVTDNLSSKNIDGVINNLGKSLIWIYQNKDYPKADEKTCVKKDDN